MNWEYTTEYNKLLDILDQDNRPWRPIALIPEDGTKVYIKCGLSTSGKILYDVGGRNNYLTCTYIRNHDGINHCYSFEEKS